MFIRKLVWLAIPLAIAGLSLGVHVGTAQAALKTLSTGIGKETRTPHPQYSVLLSFAKAKGPYVNNVAVDIHDAQGKDVLHTTSSGPWLFVGLPQGEYHVIAKDEEGRRTGAAFKAPASGQAWVHLAF